LGGGERIRRKKEQELTHLIYFFVASARPVKSSGRCIFVKKFFLNLSRRTGAGPPDILFRCVSTTCKRFRKVYFCKEILPESFERNRSWPT
jgi:hypothetical protein